LKFLDGVFSKPRNRGTIMRGTKHTISGWIILLVASLTVLLSAFLLLLLSQMGIIAFTGAGWLVNSFNTITGYLGYSILFFIPVLLGYVFFFVLLRTGLSRYETDQGQMEEVRFYNSGMEIFITLFFAIGVLFTAWGLQNALVSALGGVSKVEAGRIGAWGILKRLVDNGILIALWTTIVGGAGGYAMRLVKFMFLGRKLNRFSSFNQEREKTFFFETLATIQAHVERIEQNMNREEV